MLPLGCLQDNQYFPPREAEGSAHAHFRRQLDPAFFYFQHAHKLTLVLAERQTPEGKRPKGDLFPHPLVLEP